MSHELRTPLNAIIGFAEIMRDRILGSIGNPRYAEYAHDFHSSGTHLLGIINDILCATALPPAGSRSRPSSWDRAC